MMSTFLLDIYLCHRHRFYFYWFRRNSRKFHSYHHWAYTFIYLKQDRDKHKFKYHRYHGLYNFTCKTKVPLILGFDSDIVSTFYSTIQILKVNIYNSNLQCRHWFKNQNKTVDNIAFLFQTSNEMDSPGIYWKDVCISVSNGVCGDVWCLCGA